MSNDWIGVVLAIQYKDALGEKWCDSRHALFEAKLDLRIIYGNDVSCAHT